jgi:Protein of unknown function (DUF1360)
LAYKDLYRKMMQDKWFFFMLLTFATWRIAHLLAKEDGPFDIVFLLRKKAGAGFFGSLLDCFYCVSVWVAFPFGLWLGTNWAEKILSWLALSGAACLLEQATTNKKNQEHEPPDYKED